jgi:hypothetical protein
MPVAEVEILEEDCAQGDRHNFTTSFLILHHRRSIKVNNARDILKDL